MFEETLVPVKLDRKKIAAMSFQGIPEQKGLRAIYWKVRKRREGRGEERRERKQEKNYSTTNINIYRWG
tara:strand:- start:243 stop:449 length:207 start_codon:yes stop_codon:yes gene_type:complete